MGVRKVVLPTGRKVRGYFPSKKMGRMIEWESQLERDAIVLLEYSPEVASYREQPKKIIFYIDGVPYVYYPDFEVVLTNGKVIDVEVKPASKLKKKTSELASNTSPNIIRRKATNSAFLPIKSYVLSRGCRI